MPKQISFIHAADLHLDSPFQRLAAAPKHIFKDIQMSTFRALEQLVNLAIEKNVDFVLLVGDLFDNENQSLQAQIRLRRAFEKLHQANIPAFISYGNHDFIQGNIHSVSFPSNVFVFPSEEVSHFTYSKDGQALAQIYGFSYERRAIRENKAKEYKINDKKIPFHIATLHGSIENNKEHDVYAPFQVNDLLQEDFTYWALGHIHKRNLLRTDPPIVYPGNIQGRHRNETGEKGCYHVVMTEAGEELEFIPLHAIEFTSTTIDLAGVYEIHEVEEAIRLGVEDHESLKPILIDLTLENTNHLNFVDQDTIAEMIDLIHETTTQQKNWQFIYRVSIKSKINTETIVGDHFIGELAQQFNEVPVQKMVEELYNHRQARKYLTPITNDEQQFIKEEAKQLLFSKLLNEG